MKKILISSILLLFSFCLRAQDIVQVEYFTDTDLGYGLNTVMNVTASPDSNWSFTIPVSGSLPIGYHKIYIRTKDSNGQWSQTFKRSFEVLPSGTTDSVITGEWFIDTDLGYGQNTAFSISPLGNDITQSITIPPATIASLSEGYHKLYGRVQDGYGRWSETFKRNLEVVSSFNYPSVVTVEYFSSSDLGYDNCVSSALVAAVDSEWTFNVPWSIAPAGVDTLYFRVKDDGDIRWSHTTRRVYNIINGISNADFSDIQISPNPSNGLFKIQGSNLLVESVEVFSLLGERIFYQKNLDQSQIIIDLSRFTNGLYIVNIKTKQGLIQQKLIKE